MLKNKEIVINTGPTLALIAGLGNMEVLQHMYEKVFVPYEVCQELNNGGNTGFGVKEFNEANFLIKIKKTSIIQPYLKNSLDLGEASVIQTAIDKNISTVCIDESLGRRVARLSGLSLTGSLGIIICAKRNGNISFPLRDIINRMQTQGIYLSEKIISFALQQVDE